MLDCKVREKCQTFLSTKGGFCIRKCSRSNYNYIEDLFLIKKGERVPVNELENMFVRGRTMPSDMDSEEGRVFYDEDNSHNSLIGEGEEPPTLSRRREGYVPLFSGIRGTSAVMNDPPSILIGDHITRPSNCTCNRAIWQCTCDDDDDE